MKKSIVVSAIVSLAVCFGLAAQNTPGDDIFKKNPPQNGDFYKIVVEPGTNEIQQTINLKLAALKDEQLKFLQLQQEKQNAIDAANKAKNDLIQKQMDSLNKQLQNQIDNNSQAMENLKQKNKNPVASSSKNNTKQPKKKETNQTEESSLQKTPGGKITISIPKTEISIPEIDVPAATEKGKAPQKKNAASSSAVTYSSAEKKMNHAINDRRKLIQYTLGLKGVPYVYGGKTPVPGLDCSGLVTYAAKNALDISISGNAQMIYNQTTPVDLSDAEPGDLIFFKTKWDSRISHVGVFLGKNPDNNDFGNQYIFINAVSSGPRTGVIISGLNERYWKKNYYGCGRFLKAVKI